MGNGVPLEFIRAVAALTVDAVELADDASELGALLGALGGWELRGELQQGELTASVFGQL